MDDLTKWSRQQRYGKTKRKMVTMTKFSIVTIALYAQAHDKPFSVTLAWLAQRGLKQKTINRYVRLMTVDIHQDQERKPRTMQTLLENREERYGKTIRKHISLTPDSIDTIQAYATRQGISFSAAIETLALLGIGRQTAETLPHLVTDILAQLVERGLDQTIHLATAAVAIAQENSFKTDFLMLQTLWREARQDPTGFVEQMTVSLDGREQPAATVRQLHEEMRQAARTSGQKQVKKSVTAFKQEVDDA